MHEAEPLTFAIMLNLFLWDDLKLLTKIRFVFLNIDDISIRNPSDIFYNLTFTFKFIL